MWRPDCMHNRNDNYINNFANAKNLLSASYDFKTALGTQGFS